MNGVGSTMRQILRGGDSIRSGASLVSTYASADRDAVDARPVLSDAVADEALDLG